MRASFIQMYAALFRLFSNSTETFFWPLLYMVFYFSVVSEVHVFFFSEVQVFFYFS